MGLGLAHGGGDRGLLFVLFLFCLCFFITVDCGFLWDASGDGVRCLVQRWAAGDGCVSRFVLVFVRKE